MPYSKRYIATVTYDEVYIKGNFCWFDDEEQIFDIEEFLMDRVEPGEEIEIVVKKFIKE